MDVRGIHGKDATPFLLGRIVEITGGASLTANIALVKNNAYLGAQVAAAYAALTR
jgi:pseudouridine-5'-phosphate glycosidase